jgi:hypothetical protein
MLLVGMDRLRVKSLRSRVYELPHRRIGVRFSGRARHLAGVAIARPAARRKPTLAIMANS